MPDHLPTQPRGHSHDIKAARAYRQKLGLSAAWLNQLDHVAAARWPMGWNDLLCIPLWVLQPEHRLNELALLTGALSIGPALRRCTHPGTLLRAHRLIGAKQLERVLQMAVGAGDEADWLLSIWPQRASLKALGLSLLAGSVAQARLRNCLVRHFELSAHCLPSPDLAGRLVQQAMSIQEETEDGWLVNQERSECRA